jgi:hypothetical protein
MATAGSYQCTRRLLNKPGSQGLVALATPVMSVELVLDDIEIVAVNEPFGVAEYMTQVQ